VDATGLIGLKPHASTLCFFADDSAGFEMAEMYSNAAWLHSGAPGEIRKRPPAVRLQEQGAQNQTPWSWKQRFQCLRVFHARWAAKTTRPSPLEVASAVKSYT